MFSYRWVRPQCECSGCWFLAPQAPQRAPAHRPILASGRICCVAVIIFKALCWPQKRDLFRNSRARKCFESCDNRFQIEERQNWLLTYTPNPWSRASEPLRKLLSKCVSFHPHVHWALRTVSTAARLVLGTFPLVEPAFWILTGGCWQGLILRIAYAFIFCCAGAPENSHSHHERNHGDLKYHMHVYPLASNFLKRTLFLSSNRSNFLQVSLQQQKCLTS